jgi:uncharacterized protein
MERTDSEPVLTASVAATPGRATPDRLITPSSITAWLDCAHFLGLKHQVEDGVRPAASGAMGAFARLLADKGLQHEAACLADYEQQGRSVLRVPDRQRGETFAAWVTRVGSPFDEGYDVIYQMPFVHDRIRGIADFLVRVVDDSGVATYEPVDAKLARAAAKPGHVLQLCFYADAIEASTGRRPTFMHLLLGSGRRETLRVSDFGAYWRRLRSQLALVVNAPAGEDETRPEPCAHCPFCEFLDVCDSRWRAEDSLLYVAGLRSAERATLEADGVPTLAALAVRSDPVSGLRPERQAQIGVQAQLQVEAREDDEGTPPPFRLIEASADATQGRGFEQMPEPDDGDVFLDFEGHPFWRADRGLFFLFGLIARDEAGTWDYVTWWAHTEDEEGVAASQLIDYLADRRAQHPGMHVYHYNHTERSSLQRLVTEHGLGETTLTQLVDTGAFVDLLVVARNALQVGAESYSLKELERLTPYVRGHAIDKGSGAVLEYESFMADGAPDALQRIADYNEDDVRATRALRDWLLEHRPTDLPWRAAELEPDEGIPALDEQVELLHAFGEGTVEHLLGDVLGYWRREWQAHLAPLLSRCGGDVNDLVDDPEVAAGLTPVGEVPRLGKNGRSLAPAMRMRYPEQDVSALSVGDQVVFTAPDGRVGYSSIVELDADAGEVDLLWSEKVAELGTLPSVVVRNGWVSPNPKPAALSELAAGVLGTGPAPKPVALALLRRDLPRFLPGRGPAGGVFGNDLDEMLAWASGLDKSYVAIQGPPGTGKTYRGAHLVRALVKAGKRVGITAMSHHAIDNLLEEVVRVFEEEGDADELRAVKRGFAPNHGALAGVTYAGGNKAAASTNFNVVAGTTWLFAGNDMAAAPVDVLLIDEAGQLALADALSAARSTDNLILLGDPLQLPQVSQASHPGGGGRSVLEHVLGEHATMPPDRGVFLAETRRMHPDVCSFISDEIYEGRLTSHASCAVQTTELGTGLRWLRAEHAGRVTESEEEAELLHDEITRMIGTPWTDQHGRTAPMRASDVLVVAPYNDQVALVRARLDADPITRGVAVGTVDKFQGRQAAVVFFTMTTSTAADMSRSGDFLFSRNRFNVAVSRARCLAYVVCTEELLNSRGRDVEEMRLLSTICSFVERAH